jgi:hypothetical protein
MDSESNAAPAQRRTVEEWARAKSAEPWQYAAARAMRRWPIGFEMTEADFEAALHEAAHIPLR